MRKKWVLSIDSVRGVIMKIIHNPSGVCPSFGRHELAKTSMVACFVRLQPDCYSLFRGTRTRGDKTRWRYGTLISVEVSPLAGDPSNVWVSPISREESREDKRVFEFAGLWPLSFCYFCGGNLSVTMELSMNLILLAENPCKTITTQFRATQVFSTRNSSHFLGLFR